MAEVCAQSSRHGPENDQETHNIPDSHADPKELAAEPTHSWRVDEARRLEAGAQRRAPRDGDQEKAAKDTPSTRLTQLYTLSYLVFFAIVGTLARLGLAALTRYANTPVLFNGLWANVGGSVVMGFLAEDRMLFRHEWGAATRDRISEQAKRQDDDDEQEPGAGPRHGPDGVRPAAADKAHLARKKTIPLYIGLATGFCGSFTSFSAFVRDVFLAMSNDLAAPGAGAPAASRSGASSFMAMVAVVITTVGLSLGGLVFGAHCAAAAERFIPSFPCAITPRWIDPFFVFLGWGCWAGAVAMAVFPPQDAWRGHVLFALVFAPLGCLARFGLALWLNGKMAALPLGTLTANVLGTAVLGMAWDLAHVRSGGIVGCQVLQGVEDGFCGCLTTVSTWVAEMNSLGRRSAYVYGGASVLVSFAVLVLVMGGLRWTEGWLALAC